MYTIFVIVLLAAVSTAELGNFLRTGMAIGGRMAGKPLAAAFDVVNNNGLKDKIGDIKQPIDQTITMVGNSQCANVKRLIGVDYEQIPGLTEPELDELSLNLISDDVKATFKLRDVATSLPRTHGFDPHRPLVVFMHGFIDDPSLFAFPLVNEAYQTIGHYNVLGLDASPLIRFLYLRASTYVRFIGEKLGEALAEMVEAGLDPEDIHLVGHSLGSHIAGFAGKSFHELTGRRVGRITGLDPAGPCFTSIEDDLRLRKTDADYVDVIHTDDGVYGLREAVGHADYFPNGGERQPNCLFQFCSHLRVVELYAESVRSPALFPAQRCNSYKEFQEERCSEDTSLMGFGSRRNTRGQFYLRTAESQPFALGRAGLRARGERRRGVGNVGRFLTSI